MRGRKGALGPARPTRGSEGMEERAGQGRPAGKVGRGERREAELEQGVGQKGRGLALFSKLFFLILFQMGFEFI